MKRYPYVLGFIGMVFVVAADLIYPADPVRAILAGLILVLSAVICSSLEAQS